MDVPEQHDEPPRRQPGPPARRSRCVRITNPGHNHSVTFRADTGLGPEATTYQGLSARKTGTTIMRGLRVSEATSADIEHLELERGHRNLAITRKGGKVVTIPLAPRTARVIDLAIGERASGPLFTAADRRRLDRHAAVGTARPVPAAPGPPSTSARTRCTPRSSPQP